MNLLAQGIAINNHGVKLLQDGDAINSAVAFHRAVVVLRAFSEEASSSIAASSAASSSSTVIGASTYERFKASVNRRGHSAFNFERPSCVGRVQEVVATTVTQQSGYFIYQHPLVLATPNRFINQDALEDVVLMTSAATLFNMALSWHQQAISGFDSSPPSLKAAQLYDLVLTVLDNSIMDDDDDRESLYILKCLVLNNRAHLHYEHGNYEESQDCIQALHHLLVSTFAALKHHVGADEADEIRLNVMRIQSLSAASAA